MKGLDIMIGKGIAVGRRAAKGAWWLCVCALVACTADDLPAPAPTVPVPSVPGETGIYVSGGRDKVTMTSGKRYLDPDNTTDGPQLEGVCRADRVDVFMYTVERRYNGYPEEDDFGFEKLISYNLSVMGDDRYAEANFSCGKNDDVKYIYATALAYQNKDVGCFAPVLENTNRTNPLLKVNDGQLVPELYYGVVHVDQGSSVSTENRETCEPNSEDEDSFWWGHNHTAHPLWEENSTLTSKFKGRIFRIVSQINLEVTEVEKSLVKSMELLANNIPQQITLYGTHGTNYPVAACTEGHTSGGEFVSLDKVSFEDETGDATVVLSSFFLPSEVGMKLRLRVEYRQEIDSEGNTSKVYELQPARSYYLTGADAKAYNVEKSELKNGNDLYVYDGSNYCFYSYANVRVNLSGHFENVATDTGDAEITIEVEPNFEKEHHYEIAN